MASPDLQSLAFKKSSSDAAKPGTLNRSSSFVSSAVLPVRLQPAAIRPIAYRVLSKKHGLNLKSSGLEVLADYVGRKFGREWRQKSEQFLDRIGRRWKEQDRGLFIEGDLLQIVIRDVELRSASFTTSTSSSFLDTPVSELVEDSLENFCPQEFFHVWDAFNQPRWTYNKSQKHFERGTKPSLFASAKHQVQAFTSRYYLLLHRLLRNELFQPPSFHAKNAATWHAITQIKNLLGRHGQSFLILGLLVKGSNGNWWAEDPSGELELELDEAISTCGYVIPGCILLFEGKYLKSEKFQVNSVKHPPPESRNQSREAYGYLDFMGIGGIGSTPDGRFDKAIELKMVAEEKRKGNESIVSLGCDLHLDDFRTFEALDKILSLLDVSPPLAIILAGSFMSLPFYSNGISSRYRDYFDQLAQLLSKFPNLCERSTFIFVPGDNDPWGSTSSAGGPMLWPQSGLPEVFTSHVRRKLSRVIWASNPCRICYFSQEILVCRDNMASRLRRNRIFFKNENQEEPVTDESMDTQVDDTNSEKQSLGEKEAAMIAETILSQAHISPWPSSLRPTMAEYQHSLSLTPLPTAIFLLDPDGEAASTNFVDCTVMNPSRFLLSNKREVGWIEFLPATRKSKGNSVSY
ncbi:DNA polymerase alpha/epsilon subunit B-domain-containing protein [Lipomyces japonicus]|uniref:DNA polymerase alpha/epsilon subunit B-domain-containing protein n=1 Tax=Lipomyces japonicus TaxID=56871 RepID=UPI0034CE4153